MKKQNNETKKTSVNISDYKRAYSFDWDDNILNMPTKIILEKKVRGKWAIFEISTSEFTEVRHKLGKNYRFVDNDEFKALKGFRNYKMFQSDVHKAIDDKLFGPSFTKFKEAIIYGNEFSIITARGQTEKAIKDGIMILIERCFTKRELNKTIKNLKGKTIEEYIDSQTYHTVSSNQFKRRFGEDINSETGKVIALRHFVDKIIKAANKLKTNTTYSVGFSDDDLGNLKVIEKFINKELKKIYPDIKFLIYDTSNPEKTKKKELTILKK